MRSGRDMEVPEKFLNGHYLGDVEGCLVGEFIWTQAGKYGWMVGWKFLIGPQQGDPEGSLVGKFGMAPGWGNQKVFWLEIVKVRRSEERTEMWSGGLKEDVTQSNRQVWARQMRRLGAKRVQWTANYSEVSKPRLFVHTHRDDRTKG